MKDFEKTRNIAIVRLSALGDIIHTLPVLKPLKEKFPQASITWFAQPPGAALLENFELIDEIVPVKLKNNSLVAKLVEVKRLLKNHKNRFDIVLDFQGLIKSSVLSYLLKGEKIGFHRNNLREKEAAVFYNQRASFLDNSIHVIKKNLHLLSVMDIDAQEINWPLKSFEGSEKLVNFLKQQEFEPGKFITLNVGAGWATKKLSIEQNIQLLNIVSREHKVVILWGNEKERLEAEELHSITKVPITPFLGFRDLISLVKLSSLLITSDTMVLHIADMVQTKSIGIFGPTSPERNGSLNPASSSISKKGSCSFCYKRKCDKISCIKDIKAEDIFQEIEKIL